jgi:hypothetical protein
LENLKGKNHFKDLGVEELILLGGIKKCWIIVDWIHLAQGRDLVLL